MPVVLDNDVGDRAALYLWSGSAWVKARSDADGHFQIDVLSSALPTGAATAANQLTEITALQLIDDLRNALGSVNTDDLQVDVKTSALPTGAATAANQSTMITALQLIDDLRNALASVGADELRMADPRERAPLMVTALYVAGAVAPHAATSRWSYTVPAGKKARVEWVYAGLIQDAVATAAGYAEASVRYTPSGGTVTRLTDAIKINLALGSEGHVGAGLDLMMLAGDNLNAITNDANTGGTILYLVSAKVTEYDA